MGIKNAIYTDNMNNSTCPHCGATMKKTWHHITPGLVDILVKCYVCVSKKGENVFKMHDLDLTHSEYGNFQKLRFFGLIAKRKENGEIVPKEWLITRRGGDFIKGQEAIPESVMTFRNRVEEHDNKTVFIRDVIGSKEYWQVDFGFELYKPQPPIQMAFV